MALEKAPCLACGAEAPVEATTCTNCDYDVNDHQWPRLALGGIGMMLALTVVLAPFGIPLLMRAYRHQMAMDGSITARADRDLLGHLSQIMRYHLELNPESSSA